MFAVASAILLLTPMLVLASPEDEEKKVFAELSALSPKDHVVSVEALYNKWQEVQEKKSNAVILEIRTGLEFYDGHLPADPRRAGEVRPARQGKMRNSLPAIGRTVLLAH